MSMVIRQLVRLISAMKGAPCKRFLIRTAALLAGVVLLPCASTFSWPQSASAAQIVQRSDVASIVLGRTAVALNGPWKFHEGDNVAWANPNFDDSKWEQVDLTAPAGSHDADVGLSGYVDGWGGRGHRGMSGYGWYRLHLDVRLPNDQTLSITGPPAVDSAYQIFWNGQLLGSAGAFRTTPPQVFSIQPRIFSVTPAGSSSETGEDVLAVRVWMAQWDLADPNGGGIRIAPTVGTTRAVQQVYESEWMETVRGYVVEVIEALGFAFVCVGAWLLAGFDAHPKQYRWLYAALLLTGAYRLNQAIFFWGKFESVPAFEWISQALLYPLGLAAWTIAWARLLRFKSSLWSKVFAAVTASYLACALVQHGIFHGAAHPPASAFLQVLTIVCRLFYLASTGWFLCKWLATRSRYRWLTGAMLVLVSVGQFATELSQIGVPGIWFPFGTGVSRAQFAYALFFVSFAFFFSLRLKEFAKKHGA